MVRRFAKSSQRVIDVLVLVVAFVLAFLLRFDWVIPPAMAARLVRALPIVVGFQYLLLVGFGVPRFSWRFVGLREAVRVLEAIGIGAVALLVVRAIAGHLQDDFPTAEHALIPFGVTVIDLVLAFLGIIGIRGVRRVLGERAEAPSPGTGLIRRDAHCWRWPSGSNGCQGTGGSSRPWHSAGWFCR